MDNLKQNLRDCIEFLTVCWVFLMLTVFPIYAPEKYQELGGYKFSFFSGVSVLFLVPGIALAVVYGCGQLWKLAGSRTAEKNGGTARKRSDAKQVWSERHALFSVTDAGVFCYLIANLISYALSSFKSEAWEGVGGWNMGLRTQLLMIAAYVLISRFFPCSRGGRKEKVVLAGAAIGTGLAFLLGILHRFDIDPLGMYTGIDSSYKIWFLSTLGQATWYSSFVCTVLPVGVCFFCFSKQQVLRFLWGIYCALGFMTLVTQNSDSAFAALGFMFFGLFLACCYRPEWMKRFLETLMLCAVSFLAVGFLQKIFADRAIQLGSLSMMFSQGKISWILLAASAGAWLLLNHMQKRARKQSSLWTKYRRIMQIITLAVFIAGLAALVSVIAWNTRNAAAGGSAMIGSGSYMIFNNSWGSNRGFTWKTTVKIFEEMPLLNKLFGAGPDCFYYYSYQLSSYGLTLHNFWKPDILTNAHNEFLNLLICTGVFGLAAFLLLLLGGAVRFCRAGKKDPLVLMGLLTICSYAAHNFFCYQQVCCTPFLFLILGLAERRARQNLPV